MNYGEMILALSAAAYAVALGALAIVVGVELLRRRR